SLHSLSSLTPPPPRSTLFPYTTLFRSTRNAERGTRKPERPGARPRTNHRRQRGGDSGGLTMAATAQAMQLGDVIRFGNGKAIKRSEEHTSELQSRSDLVCRLLLEKKKK